MLDYWRWHLEHFLLQGPKTSLLSIIHYCDFMLYFCASLINSVALDLKSRDFHSLTVHCPSWEEIGKITINHTKFVMRFLFTLIHFVSEIWKGNCSTVSRCIFGDLADVMDRNYFNNSKCFFEAPILKRRTLYNSSNSTLVKSSVRIKDFAYVHSKNV